MLDSRIDDITARGVGEQGQIRQLGKVIDNLIATDVPARGVVDRLHEAALAQSDGRPLALAAAEALRERVRPGSSVLICTGWPSRSWLMEGLTETDGPVGAGYLARVIEQTLGCVPVMVVSPALTRFAEVALGSAGLIVADETTAQASKNGPHNASVGAVHAFTTDPDRAERDAAELLERLDVSAVIATEIPGANASGEYFNTTGRKVPDQLVTKADALIRQASAKGILTVGIGDGGNELGMGNIADRLGDILSGGPQAAPVTTVDHLVVASVSNFGAVGISAALAALTGKPRLLRNVDLQRITDRVSDAGAIDGLTSYVDPNNDGLTPASTRAFTETVATAVEMHLGRPEKG